MPQSTRRSIALAGVIGLFATPTIAPAAGQIAVLTDDTTLEVRDASTDVRRYRTELAGPAARRIALAVSDVVADLPGAELLAVREDGYVDVFPLPSGGTPSIKRAKLIGLARRSGEHRFRAIAIEPGTTEKPAVVWAVVDDGDGWRLSHYVLQPGAENLKPVGYTPIKPDTQLMLDDGVAALMTKQGDSLALSITRGSVTARSADRPSSPLPAEPLPPVEVRADAKWTPAYAAGDQKVAFPADLAGFTTRASIDNDPEGAGDTVLIAGNEKHIVLPVNAKLPPGTTGVGLWMTERRDNNVRFVLRDATGRRYLHADYREGMQPGPNPFVWVSHDGGVLAWHVRRAALAAPAADDVVLESIIVDRRTPEASIEIGPVLASTHGDFFTATRVWKLKNHQSPKPDSTFWTGNRYYDYGFNTNAHIRPPAWRIELGDAKPTQIRFVIRTMAGEPLLTSTTGAIGDSYRLPRLPVGCYPVDFSALDEDGAILRAGRFIYQVLRDDDLKTRGTVTAEVPPYRVEGLNLKGGPSAKVGQPLEASLRFAALMKATITHRVTNVEGRVLLDQTQEFKAGDRLVNVSLPTQHSGGFRWTIEFRRGDKLVAREEYLYGVADDTDAKAAAIQPTASNAPAEQRPIVLSQTKVTGDPDQTARLPQESLPKLVDWTYEHGMVPSYLVFWRELEPVEGCYNWDAVDRYLAMCKPGQQAAVGINFSGDNLPDYLWFEELLSQSQQTIHHDYHYASPFGPRLRAAQERLWRAVLTKYRDDPRIVAWALQAGPSEGFITDTPPNIADYSGPAISAFRAVLKERYGTIDALNRAWGNEAKWKSFDDVRPPVPDYALDWESSPAWWDWHTFKNGYVPQYLDRLQKLTRELDPQRRFYMYAKEGFGLPGALGPVFKRNQFVYSNGGGEGNGSVVQVSIMRGYGVPVLVEPGQVQANAGTIARLTAYSLLAGGYGGHNLQWGLVWSKKPHVGEREYDVLGDMCASMSKHAEELSHTQPAVKWAGFYSANTELLTTRSMRCRLYPTTLELLRVSQQSLGGTPCAWVDDATSLDVLRQYPLIVDGGSRILTEESAAIIEQYVKDGGVYVCDATAGMFKPGSAEANFHLLRRFGFAHPFDQTGAGVETTNDGAALVLKSTRGEADNAVIEKALGKGRVILVAGEIDRTKSAAWIKQLVERHAGKAPYRVSGEHVISGVLKGRDAEYVVLHPTVRTDGKDNNQPDIKQVDAAGMAVITIEGLQSDATVSELIEGKTMTASDGKLLLQAPRGLLRIVKVTRK